MTALVGPSGGGKSTVLNLILRLLRAERGAILIDGQDIAEVSRRSLRQQIAYVGQDVFLFHGTIRENIAFGKPGASEEEIVAAAKAANAHEFIMGFPPATTRRSANTARNCPAASASASRSRAR